MSRVRLRDGYELQVDVAGSGPACLLVHGFTGSSAAWGNELRRGLERELRVLAPDLLGHGRSDRPGGEDAARRYSLDQMVTDLCEVLDVFGVRRALWIGYSMGGRVSLGAAMLRPERVAALILEGASPGLSDSGEAAARAASDEALALRLEREGVERFMRFWTSLELFRTQRTLPDDLRRREYTRRLENDAAALAACLRGLGTGVQPSFWKQLGEYRRPALLLAGEHDAKYREIARRMAVELFDAEAETIVGAGHAVHLEQPEAYLAAVRRFCRRLSRGDL